jgi:LPS sulfotransferase NodH
MPLSPIAMPVLLLAQPRTGTTLFRSLVNQHPAAYFYGEVLFPDFFAWGFFSYLSGRLRDDRRMALPTHWHDQLKPYLTQLAGLMHDAGKAVVGFDLKIPQLGFVPDFHRAIVGGDFPIIHLRRRSVLGAIVSYETMSRRVGAGRPAHGSRPERTEPIHLDPAWLALRVAEFETQDGWINLTYRAGRYLELHYEDLSPAGWGKVCERLSAFLGLDFTVPFRTVLEKQNDADLSRLIANFDEISAVFPHLCEPVTEAA